MKIKKPTPEEIKLHKIFLKDRIAMWQRINDSNSDELSERHLQEWKKHLVAYNSNPYEWKKKHYV